MSLLDDDKILFDNTSLNTMLAESFPTETRYELNRSYIPVRLSSCLEWHSDLFGYMLPHNINTISIYWDAGGDSYLMLKFSDSNSSNFWKVQLPIYNKATLNEKLAKSIFAAMKENVDNIEKLYNFIVGHKCSVVGDKTIFDILHGIEPNGIL